MIGTLTLSDLNSLHISIKAKNLYKSFAVATIKALETLLSKNYVRVVDRGPDLQAASFYDARYFFDYSFAIKLLLLLILIK